jgi:hypothetical protein
MRSFVDYIEYIVEGQVDGLRDVKKIRHYTTGAALKKILSSGFIQPNESPGDEDWRDYPIKDKKVVSFHDERTDPEYDTLISCNRRKESIEGQTYTLALHMKKICACIEIDYDKIDKAIQDRTHLLNIYGTKAEHFVNMWNYNVGNAKDDNEYYIHNKIKEELAELFINAIETKNKELIDSLKYVWGEFSFGDKFEDEEAKLANDAIRKIFLQYYDEETLNSTYKGRFDRDRNFYVDKVERQMGWGFGYGVPTLQLLKNTYVESKRAADFAKRHKLKPFSEEDGKLLAEYTVKFDWINIVKLLKAHGWQPGDSKIQAFLGSGIARNNKKVDGSLIRWLDKLMSKKDRIVNMDIEIRIASPVELTKDNCTIKIFNGICDATKQSALKSLPKKYYNKYNIEHIEPEAK